MPETVYKPIPEAVFAMLEEMEIPVNVSEDEIVHAVNEAVTVLGGRPKRP